MCADLEAMFNSICKLRLFLKPDRVKERARFCLYNSNHNIAVIQRGEQVPNRIETRMIITFPKKTFTLFSRPAPSWMDSSRNVLFVCLNT